MVARSLLQAADMQLHKHAHAGRLWRQHAGHSCSIVDQILMLQLGVHLQSGEESAASTMQPDEGLDLSLVLFPARRVLPAV